MIIVVANEKGGTGKTTLATNLAVYRAINASDVLLVDADPQNSCRDFVAVRDEEAHQPTVTCASITGKSLAGELRKMEHKFDDIVVDVGGRDSTSMRSALLAADVVLIPFSPSQLDAWSLEKMDQLIHDVKQLNENLIALSVINRADTNPKIILSNEASDFADELENIEFLNLRVGDRVAYRRAVAEGLAVTELPSSKRDAKAISEIKNLYNEVFNYEEKAKAIA